MLFNIQSVRIQRKLSQFFDFVFLDGPFESPAGPGVLPFFEGCDPFYSWVRQTRGALLPESKAAVENAMKGRESEFVGVMGFSQGARLGAGLLLEQQLRQKENEGNRGGFKFGVFLMGTSPPLVSASYSKEEEDEIVSIPSVHFVGTQDPYQSGGKDLFDNYFDQSASSLTELEIGHRLPVVEEDTMKIVDGIKLLYRKTTGKALVDLGAN